MLKNTLVVLISTFALSFAANAQTVRPATEKETQLILESVQDKVRDPEAARIKDVMFSEDSDGTITVCGLVNGKNVYGGYVGFSKFIGMYFPITDKQIKPLAYIVSIDTRNQVVAEMCAEKGI